MFSLKTGELVPCTQFSTFYMKYYRNILTNVINLSNNIKLIAGIWRIKNVNILLILLLNFDRRKTIIKMKSLKQKSSETHLKVILHDTGALSPK